MRSLTTVSAAAILLLACGTRTLASQPVPDGFRSVTAFGAVGDGRTDDTAALQQALDGARRVYVPPGVYRTRTLYVPSDTELIGAGERSVLRLSPDTDRSLIQNADPDRGNRNIRIARLRLEGNRGRNGVTVHSGAHGVELLHVRGAAVEAVTATDFHLDGIYAGRRGIYALVVRDGRSHRVRVGGPCEDIVIRDNRIVANQRNGISITHARRVQIAGNTVRGNNLGVRGASPELFRAGAIDVEPSRRDDIVQHVVVERNRVENNHYSGIVATRPGVVHFSHISVSDNLVRENGYHGIAVLSNSLREVRVEGNEVVQNEGVGVVVNGARDVTVRENRVRSNQSTGVLVNRGARSVRLVKNVIHGNGGPGIALDSVADIELRDNTMERNRQGAYRRINVRGVKER